MQTFSFNIVKLCKTVSQSKFVREMQQLLILFSLVTLVVLMRNPVRMFDFRESGQKNNCTPYKCDNLDLMERNISEITAMMLMTEPDEKLPEQVTICSTIYADFREFGDRYSITLLPHWAFVDGNGKPNLSVEVYHWKDEQVTIDLMSSTLPCNSDVCHWTRFGIFII